jgi:DNA-directed RNA polymerase subunit RPC12/RpoP
MAVEIVNEVPDPKVIREVVCPYCGVKLRFIPNDINQKDYTDISQVRDTHYWINCAKCRAEISVSKH